MNIDAETLARKAVLLRLAIDGLGALSRDGGGINEEEIGAVSALALEVEQALEVLA